MILAQTVRCFSMQLLSGWLIIILYPFPDLSLLLSVSYLAPRQKARVATSDGICRSKSEGERKKKVMGLATMPARTGPPSTDTHERRADLCVLAISWLALIVLSDFIDYGCEWLALTQLPTLLFSCLYLFYCELMQIVHLSEATKELSF